MVRVVASPSGDEGKWPCHEKLVQEVSLLPYYHTTATQSHIVGACVHACDLGPTEGTGGGLVTLVYLIQQPSWTGGA